MSALSQIHDVSAACLKLIVPGEHFEAITASNTPFTDENRPRAIYIGVSGTIDVVDLHGHATASVAVVAGTVIPNIFSKVTAITSASIYGIR
jgi:hypothetical protein